MKNVVISKIQFLLLGYFLFSFTQVGFTQALAQNAEKTLSVDEAFAQLARYEYGQTRQALAAVERLVEQSTSNRKTRNEAAKRLAAVLDDPKATDAAKAFVLQQLSLVADETQVPVLKKMLDDPKTAGMALYALEGIPGEVSGRALRGALEGAGGNALISVIQALGARRDAKATGDLGKLLRTGSPGVAPAAAHALGEIGTPDAAKILERAASSKKLASAVIDARLLCAERLAEDGKTREAGAIYEKLWAAGGRSQWRLAALSGLAAVRGEKALPQVLEAIGSDETDLRANAIRLSVGMRGRGVTEALAKNLEGLDAKGQALLINALADRGDRAAALAVAGLMESEDADVQLAAIRAMAALGDASAVAPLAKMAAKGPEEARKTARSSLTRLKGAKVDGTILRGLSLNSGDVPVRVELLNAAAARGARGAGPALTEAAGAADVRVRVAAWDALATAADTAIYPQLVALLTQTKGQESKPAVKAVLAVGNRLPELSDRVDPVLASLPGASKESKIILLGVLAAFGGQEALIAVRGHLDDAVESVRDAAARAMSDWVDVLAAEDLYKMARESASRKHKTLALRGYLRLARAAQSARMTMLTRARDIATTPESKTQLLMALTELGGAEALTVAAGMLDDEDVRDEAAQAVLKTAGPLARKERDAVASAMNELMKTSRDAKTVAKAKALLAKAESPVDVLAPAPYGPEVSAARLKELRDKVPEGLKVVCYVDCGVEGQKIQTGGPSIRQVNGRSWQWPGSAKAAAPPFGTIAFDDRKLLFDVSGLNPEKFYALGFSWWDFDKNGRVQSVEIPAAGGREAVILQRPTPLPAYRGGKVAPAQMRAPVAKEYYADGKFRVEFVKHGQSNVAVSEMWLWEADVQIPARVPARAAGRSPGRSPARGGANQPAAKQIAKKVTKKVKPIEVLIVTGIDHPAHNWRETTPVLRALLEEDPRLRTRVVEDPHYLNSPRLDEYDVIVLHFMNFGQPAPGDRARENLMQFVQGGKGLVLVHFACGAFQEWPEFRDLVGRVWDPKLRGHDKRGPFLVEITDVKHPVTLGMEDFETDDELYTCLTGDLPVGKLAEATSKVDGKDQPMVFVFSVGKGRVFHCVLGHDVKALTAHENVGELFRRGCAWAAGLAPLEKKE